MEDTKKRSYRSIPFALLVLCLSVPMLIPGTANAQCGDLLGKWWTPDEKSKIEVYKKGDTYYADIVWMKNPRKEDGALKRDKNNPDPDKRDRTIQGLTIFKGMKCTEENMLEDGTLYDPESGKTYSGWMALEDANTLKVRGYIGISMIGRTEYFERVD